jgi:hypothetical protein
MGQDSREISTPRGRKVVVTPGAPDRFQAPAGGTATPPWSGRKVATAKRASPRQRCAAVAWRQHTRIPSDRRPVGASGALSAKARGVNAGLAERRGRLPPEAAGAVRGQPLRPPVISKSSNCRAISRLARRLRSSPTGGRWSSSGTELHSARTASSSFRSRKGQRSSIGMVTMRPSGCWLRRHLGLRELVRRHEDVADDRAIRG